MTLNRSESKLSANIDSNVAFNNPINVNINFVLMERDKDKFSANSRRSSKNSILSQMSSFLQRISHKVPIEVFAVTLEISVIRSITNYLEVDEDDQNFQKSVQVVVEK